MLRRVTAVYADRGMKGAIGRLAGIGFALAVVVSAGCGAAPSGVRSDAPTSAPDPASLIASDPVAMDARYEAGLPLFDYDPASPLNLTGDDEALPRAGWDRYAIEYDSPRGGRVPSTLLAPHGDGPFPAIILQHGSGSNRASLSLLADRYVTTGAVVLLIDAPFARRGGEFVRFVAEDRDEQIQLVMDLRRAVDLLTARDDVHADRIGFHGISYGAMIGGLLSGVEDRVAAYVLAVGDGGLVQHFAGPDDAGGPLDQLPDDERRAWLELMEPIESIYFVRHAAPAELLFHNAINDELIPRSDAERFQAAGSDPKIVQWYESTHLLPVEAECDAAAWLADRIGIDATAYLPACD
jgi:uncharacterized protein